MSRRATSSSRRTRTQSRPVSAVETAGFSSGGPETSGGRGVLDPLKYAADNFAQFLKESSETPDVVLRNFKRNINVAVQESSRFIAAQDPQKALVKAKEAETELKQMQELINSKKLDEPEFYSYKSTVLLQLADAYKANQMWDEARHRYNRILKDKSFPYQYQIYLELGNISFEQENYTDAVKNFQMGFDLLAPEARRYRARFLYSIGVSYIRQNKFSEALSSFEQAMPLDPNIKTGFNLVLCHAILNSIEDIRDAYSRLIAVKPYTTAITNEGDVLSNQLHVQRREEIRLVMLASRLVASRSDKNWQEGYEFVMNKLKQSKFPEAEGEFEIAFALAYLNHRNTQTAIDMLRQIRKKDPSLIALAANNLSFLYFLEKDFESADEFATKALEFDKYNAQALVNKGNCLFQSDHLDDARDLYLEAIGVEGNCVEALFNLGIADKKLDYGEEAFRVFEKLSRILPKSPEVLFEICDFFALSKDTGNEIEWLHRLINLMPSDPGLWKRIGLIWDRENQETQAFHCFSESFKYCPSDLDVINWFATYHIQHRNLEKALEFLERGAAVAPKDTRILLRIGSCHMQMDNKQTALEIYEKVHQMDPDNKTCLEQLVKVSRDLSLGSQTEHYQQLLEEFNYRSQMEEEIPRQSQTSAPAFSMERQEPSEAPVLKIGNDGSGLGTIAQASEGAPALFDDIDVDLSD